MTTVAHDSDYQASFPKKVLQSLMQYRWSRLNGIQQINLAQESVCAWLAQQRTIHQDRESEQHSELNRMLS